MHAARSKQKRDRISGLSFKIQYTHFNSFNLMCKVSDTICLYLLHNATEAFQFRLQPTEKFRGKRKGLRQCHCLSQHGSDFAALDVELAYVQEYANPLILQSAFILLALLAGRPLLWLKLKRLPD